jgi:acetyltransferase-like isoleucine patch superfamily enzyme
MQLPAPLVKTRSAAAQGAALPLRVLMPILIRVMRFCYEVRARSLLRGRVAAGVQFVGPINAEGTGRVHIAARTRVGRRVFFETQGEGRIDIGEHVTINDGVVITAHSSVNIGAGTMIGEYTSIRDANHGTGQGVPLRRQPHDAAPVSIGRDVWLGRGVMVTKGLRIEDGAVIGANSVVTKDVAKDTIAAGAPASHIGKRTPAGSAPPAREE